MEGLETLGVVGYKFAVVLIHADIQFNWRLVRGRGKSFMAETFVGKEENLCSDTLKPKNDAENILFSVHH